MDADLTYADFSYADVSGADFSGATLVRARFHKTKEDDAVWSASKKLALGDDAELAKAEAWRPTPETTNGGARAPAGTLRGADH